MTGLGVVIMVVTFVTVILLSSRFFYMLEIKSFIRQLTARLGLDIMELEYSFEQIVYFTTLPSNLPVIKHAKREDVVIKLDFHTLFMPGLAGIKIGIRTEGEDMDLAYLPIKDFRFPILDQLLEQGQINESEYLKISTFKLTHLTTLDEIADEIYKQMMVGRNGKLA